MSESLPRVLMVEADAIQRDLIALALSRLNVSVFTTGSAQQVEAHLLAHRPDLMLLDVYLPQTNGLELLRQLKSKGLLGKTAVIVLSSLGFQEVVEQAVQAGALYFMVKPVDTDLLVKRVREILKI